MSLVRGVMWLGRDAPSFRRHVAHHTQMAKANTGEKTPDPRSILTHQVETRVRNALAGHMALSPCPVLRWEARDIRNRWIEKFREHDGVFEAPDGRRVVLEVKASASKGSLKTGLAQLRATLAVAQQLQPKTIGLLAIANLSALTDLFGKPSAELLGDHFANKEVIALEWPACSRFNANAVCYVTFVPENILQEWWLQMSPPLE